MGLTITVLVAPACVACAGAVDAVRRFAARTGAHLEAVVVGAPGWIAPDVFVGTPMVLIADNVVSYGTPTAEQLSAAYEEATARG